MAGMLLGLVLKKRKKRRKYDKDEIKRMLLEDDDFRKQMLAIEQGGRSDKKIETEETNMDSGKQAEIVSLQSPSDTTFILMRLKGKMGKLIPKLK